MTTDGSKVQVFVRIRPLLKQYGEEFSVQCARKTTEDTIAMSHPSDDSANSGKQHSFAYNCVFDGDDSQTDLYEAVKGLVDSTLDGHNATIFTYGQTGSGKTHTVLGEVNAAAGEDMELGPQTGLYMRVLDDLLKYKHANAANSHVVIALSILEIHNEEIRDLLKNCKTLNLQRNRHGDDGVPNVTLREVNSLQQCFKVYQIGTAHRSVASTNMNRDSSRSHAVFQIEVVQQEKTAANPLPPNPVELYQADFTSSSNGKDQPFPVKRSRLCLVDLAGSERLKKSGAEGATLKETQAINTSLTCLGNVVNALFENKDFINYRDSKLTMLLKSSFERANAKILLITNISPIEPSYSESMGSLRFADRVMNLKASKSFALDPHAECEYMDCLRQQAELAADLRIAIATYDLKLHGGQRLKEIKTPKGTFNKETLQLLTEEAKQHQKQAKERELQKFINKIVLKRKVVEETHARNTQELEWQLKIDEQDLLTTAMLNDQVAYQESIANCKAEFKTLKSIAKQCTKNLDKLTQTRDALLSDYTATCTEAQALTDKITSEEMAFAERGELPSDMAQLVPPPAPQPQSPSSDDRPTDSPAAEASKNASATSSKEKSPASSQDSSRPQSPRTEGPGSTTGKSSPKSTSSNKEATMEELEAASKMTSELAKQRAAAEKNWEERYTQVKRFASQSLEEKDSSSDEEETPSSSSSKSTDQVALDRKRQKELFKLSGLTSAEIKRLMALRGGGD
eukprot:TRINITY_DN68030_c8_g1_i1.p1 TRINITY_DN68030_c8_g1~~TRINITY_DN68030_c8_g1_i1.p1  ORF type:complete len:742 (-),score=55.94 TRINITY_DN68030_c8_g1_i1:2141-4366(-)